MAKIICTQAEYDKLTTVLEDNPQFLAEVRIIYDIVEESPTVPKDYIYDTETDEFLVYRHKYTGREIHIVKDPEVYLLKPANPACQIYEFNRTERGGLTMANYCITCKFCDYTEGHICTLGRLLLDDPYSSSCASYESQKEPPYSIGVDLAEEPKEDYRLCPDCQQSVNYDDMIWLNGRCTCPSCYIRNRAEYDS